MATSDIVHRFLTQLRADGRSPHTVGQYRRHLRLLGEWWARESPGGDVRALTHEAIAAFLTSDEALLRTDGEPKAATTINALRSSVRGFFGYLERSGQLASNPARVVRMARVPENPPEPLKPSEVERLLGALAAGESVSDRRDHALFAFLLATGARLSSSLALDVGDLDLDAGEARLTKLKGGGRLKVFLTPAVVALLRLEVGERRSGPVFVARGDGRLSARHVQRRFGHWLEVAELPRRYSPHSLRHTFAMELYQRTGDLLVVKEALGHRSIASTMVYARAGAERVRSAVLG